MAANEIQSLSRAIAILDCFSVDRPQLGVREVARLLDMSASTVGRLLAALTAAGILNQDPSSRLYMMGPRVMAWSAVYTDSLDVRESARPMLEELHRLTNETVSLYVLERDHRLCVARIESKEPVRVVVKVGEQMPLHAGSAGKALLAFMSAAEAEKILDGPLGKMTQNTIVSRRNLMKELETIRARGYATSHGERFEDAIGMAAPVFDAEGRVIAALNVAGPKMRFTDAQVEKFVPKIMQLADKLSRMLGYDGESRIN